MKLNELIGKQIHFIGIGGSGMSGLARIALSHGIKVSGSDKSDSQILKALSALGAQIYIGHDAKNVDGADLIVFSNAINSDNCERQAAGAIPIITRAAALALLMSESISIAVAGTHGKTTTSSMLTVAMQACGADPSFAIGGLLKSSGSNAHRGTGKYFVAEADESDGSFVAYHPNGAVITNVEWDHVDHFKTESEVIEAFNQFVGTISSDGFLVFCADDDLASQVAKNSGATCISYGKSQSVDLRIDSIELTATGGSARLLWHGAKIGQLVLQVPGEHNLLNAAAAVAVGLHLELPINSLLDGLANFRGAGRRFELKGSANGVRVIDDYGHHPTEIDVTLAAAKRFAGDGRVLVIFQPHRYSRTKTFLDKFAKSLSVADQTWLLEIYAASEQPISDVTSEKIANQLPNGKFEPNFLAVTESVVAEAKPGDVIITLGAGDVSSLGPVILEALDRKQN